MSTGPGESAVLPERNEIARSPVDTLLDELVEWVGRCTPFERVLAVAGFEGEFRGRGLNVPEREMRTFLERCRDAAPMVRQGFDDALDEGAGFPVGSLDSWRDVTLLRARTPERSFVAAVAVEAPPSDPALGRVRTALDRAAANLAREAELHALRSRVRELEEQRRHTRVALDALPDPVLVVDQETRILLSNVRADELFVTDPDDSGGRRHAIEKNNLFFSAFRARALLDRHGTVQSGEVLLVDPTDGSDLMFEVFARPFEQADGGPRGTLFILRDITDLTEATHELEVQVNRYVAAEHRARRESERLNIIIENAGIPILVTDRQTNVTLMNAEAERLLEVGVGSTGDERLQSIRANSARLAGFLNEFLLQPAARQERQLTFFDPERSTPFPVAALSTKVLDDHDHPTAVVTVLHDLTQEHEIRHLAHELRQLNTELEGRVAEATRELAERNVQLEAQRAELARASRMKSQFLATMSHELRTPINAILGYNSLLREGVFGALSERQVDGLERMHRAAEHLLSLISDILDLSRVEAGKLSFHATAVDVRACLEKLSESVRPMVAEKGLAYTLRVDPEISTIRTDETRFRQVILNLLSNAVKFTARGSVRVSAVPRADTDGIRFEVTDTGIGIKPGHLETIFQEFTQVDQSETREHGGTGLGLAICRKLIDLMGGTLAVVSTPGEGSTFTVELPAAPPAEWGDEAEGAS